MSKLAEMSVCLSVCLSVSPNFVTLSPIPLRLIFWKELDERRKTTPKSWGYPLWKKLKNQFFIFAIYALICGQKDNAF
jgi:hypothetical protein